MRRLTKVVLNALAAVATLALLVIAWQLYALNARVQAVTPQYRQTDQHFVLVRGGGSMDVSGDMDCY